MQITLSVGDTLDEAIQQAQQIVHTADEDVTFDFNGVAMIVTATSEAADLQAYYHQELKRQEDASPAHQEMLRRQAAQVIASQKLMDKLVANLPRYIAKGESYLVRWVRDYCLADMVGVTADIPAIVQILRDAGYALGFKADRADATNDEHLSAQYIIGQFMECLDDIGSVPDFFQRLATEHMEKWGK